MPKLAFIETELRCPFCDTVITDILFFQWGYCPGAGPHPESTYNVGDTLNWKKCKDGSIPAWTYFEYTESWQTANMGDPTIKHLIVKDWFNHHYLEQCNNCKEPLGGAAVEIHNNIIVRAWLCKPNEFNDRFKFKLPIPESDDFIDQTVDNYVLLENGDILPQPSWSDHSMNFMTEDCELIEDYGKWLAQNRKPDNASSNSPFGPHQTI